MSLAMRDVLARPAPLGIKQIAPHDDYLVGPGGDRISREHAIEVMRRDLSRELVNERNPGEYFDVNETIKAPDGRHVDFLFLLAKIQHESSGGTAGVAVQTHSWGNTRTPNFGATPIGTVPGASGHFPVWRTWLDGMISTAARLVTPDYVYYGWGRRAIQDVYLWFDNPATPDIDESGYVWAPAGDFNNPSGYLRAIVDYMNANRDQNAPSVQWTPPELIIDQIPVGNRNRPGTKIDVNTYVTHDTDNRTPGANAWAHRQFFHGGGGSEGVSVHSTNDDKRVYILLPGDELGIHAIKCNRYSIANEICVNSDADWTRTLMNAAWTAVWWEQQTGKRLTDIQHNGCTGKDCPKKIRQRGEWDLYLGMIRTWEAQLSLPPERDELSFPDWPFTYQLGFRAHFLTVGAAVFPSDPIAGGLSIFGYPLGQEYVAVDGNTYQPTERYVLQYQAGVGEPWDVTGLHRGTTPPARKAA